MDLMAAHSGTIPFHLISFPNSWIVSTSGCLQTQEGVLIVDTSFMHQSFHSEHCNEIFVYALLVLTLAFPHREADWTGSWIFIWHWWRCCVFRHTWSSKLVWRAGQEMLCSKCTPASAAWGICLTLSNDRTSPLNTRKAKKVITPAANAFLMLLSLLCIVHLKVFT